VRASAAFCLAVFAACHGYRDPGDSAEVHARISDRNIATRVRIVLGEDPETAAYDTIRVRCEEGVVTLEGVVDRPRVKERARDLARGCEGVRSVDDRITVQTSTDRRK